MEETNFVLLWKEQYEKIDQSLAINKQLLKEVISNKAQSALQSLSRYKSRCVVAAVIYLVLLGTVLSFAIAFLDYFLSQRQVVSAVRQFGVRYIPAFIYKSFCLSGLFLLQEPHVTKCKQEMGKNAN